MMAVVTRAAVLAMRGSWLGGQALSLQLQRLLLMLEHFGKYCRGPRGKVRQHEHGEQSRCPAAHHKLDSIGLATP